MENNELFGLCFFIVNDTKSERDVMFTAITERVQKSWGKSRKSSATVENQWQSWSIAIIGDSMLHLFDRTVTVNIMGYWLFFVAEKQNVFSMLLVCKKRNMNRWLLLRYSWRLCSFGVAVEEKWWASKVAATTKAAEMIPFDVSNLVNSSSVSASTQSAIYGPVFTYGFRDIVPCRCRRMVFLYFHHPHLRLHSHTHIRITSFIVFVPFLCFALPLLPIRLKALWNALWFRTTGKTKLNINSLFPCEAYGSVCMHVALAYLYNITFLQWD